MHLMSRIVHFKNVKLAIYVVFFIRIKSDLNGKFYITYMLPQLKKKERERDLNPKKYISIHLEEARPQTHSPVTYIWKVWNTPPLPSCLTGLVNYPSRLGSNITACVKPPQVPSNRGRYILLWTPQGPLHYMVEHGLITEW